MKETKTLYEVEVNFVTGKVTKTTREVSHHPIIDGEHDGFSERNGDLIYGESLESFAHATMMVRKELDRVMERTAVSIETIRNLLQYEITEAPTEPLMVKKPMFPYKNPFRKGGPSL